MYEMANLSPIFTIKSSATRFTVLCWWQKYTSMLTNVSASNFVFPAFLAKAPMNQVMAQT